MSTDLSPAFEQSPATSTSQFAVQVEELDTEAGVAIITVHVTHTQIDMGTEVQCLNALIKQNVPLQVVRMTGPDLCIGALACMAAYPHVLLRAAELRQASLLLFCIVLMCCTAWIEGLSNR